MKNSRPNKFGVYAPAGAKIKSFRSQDVIAKIGTLKVSQGFAWSSEYCFRTGTMAYGGHDFISNFVQKTEAQALKEAGNEIHRGAKLVIADKGSVVTPRQKSAAKKLLEWCAEKI